MSGVVAITCASVRERAAIGPAIAASAAATPAPTSVAPPLVVPDAGAEKADAGPVEDHAPRGELGRFYAALRELEQKTRKEHVRIAWIGDSHGASDFWSGRLRGALQKRFGDGGPGFVHVGYKAYRHDGVKISVDGKWGSWPKGPSTVLKTGDGIFGLGGILWHARDGGARASLLIEDQALTGKLNWDLCYKLGSKDDELLVHVGGGQKTVLRATQPDQIKRLRHLGLVSNGPGATLNVTPTSGRPELCGVTIETDPVTQPGVVLDTLGINGARMATPLAWEEPSWVAELTRRAPSLVILQFGTNESGDRYVNPANYGEHLERVMARVRKAAPETDCLVVGPTDRADRADTEERTPVVRDALKEGAAKVGCGFFDTYTAMGGKGSIEIWRKEVPPRAAGDGIHLSWRGYFDIGDKLTAAVLSSYAR
jgi:lysophospholipase L1-like esterase